MKEILSVIVPVYNVEKYLECCLNSIINQTYKYLEIILIDDGSTDDSGKICDIYAKKDARIKVIHQQNGGAANAKNAGLRIATGKYLAFVDSDDYLEEDAYEYMVNKLCASGVEVVQCSFKDVFQNVVNPRVMIEKECEMTVQEYLKRFTIDWTCGLLWNKLYLRKLFDEVFFEEGHIIDDEFFTYQGIMNAHKVIYDLKFVYNYRKRKSSIMTSSASQHRLIADKLAYLEQRRKRITEKFPELKQEFNHHYLSMLVALSKDRYITLEHVKVIKKMLRKYYAEKQKCKLEWILKLNLFIIYVVKPEVIIKKRNQACEENFSYSYFD